MRGVSSREEAGLGAKTRSLGGSVKAPITIKMSVREVVSWWESFPVLGLVRSERMISCRRH